MPEQMMNGQARLGTSSDTAAGSAPSRTVRFEYSRGLWRRTVELASSVGPQEPFPLGKKGRTNNDTEWNI